MSDRADAPRRAVVVYESMWGNTKAVAEAVADGLGERVPVECLPVAEAPTRFDGEGLLLVVGGPTHAFSMTRQSTREDAARQGATGAGDLGIREWVERLEPAPGAVVVTFDTRVKMKMPFPGSAAHAAEKRLNKAGFTLAAPGETFWVVGSPGPLLDGEVDRARAWGEGLVAAAAG